MAMIDYSDMNEKELQDFLVNLLSFHAFMNGEEMKHIAYNEYSYSSSNSSTEYYWFNIEYIKKKNVLFFETTELLDSKEERELKPKGSLIGIDGILDKIALTHSQIEYVRSISFGKQTLGKDNSTVLRPGIKPRFVLGAGVSNGYGPLSWSKIIENMKKKLIENLTFSEKETDDTIGHIFGNVNIGLPELFKQEYNKEYNAILKEGMYGEIDDEHHNDSLRAVASALGGDKADKQVLTFNYDIYLEKELFRMNGYTEEKKKHYLKTMSDDKMCSILSNEPVLSNEKITIIHNHGLIYKDDNDKKQEKGVVFTNNEYLRAYKNSNSASYKKLFNHLDKTCMFVGNSITDYEEQKVIKVRHDNCRSEFHYMLKKTPELKTGKGERISENAEKILEKKREIIERTFFKMGIIILWFEEYDHIGAFIRESFCKK